MVRAALHSQHAAVDIYQLAFHAGVAMEVLAELVATPLFYRRSVNRAESGSAAHSPSTGSESDRTWRGIQCICTACRSLSPASHAQAGFHTKCFVLPSGLCVVCRLLLHDPSAAAPLRLVLAALSLHDAPLAPPPFVRGPQGRLVPARQPADVATARAGGPDFEEVGCR